MIRDKAIQLDSSQSIYLLGQKQKFTHPIFQRYRQLIEKCADDGEFISFETQVEWLACYERDGQKLHASRPLLVFKPYHIGTIAHFIRMCYEFAIPVTVRCGGTGLAGSCVSSKEGAILLTGHLKQIKEYKPEEGSLSIESGVTVRQINQYVEPERWYFPLSMRSEGVAGLAGCLSSHARGYHQQQQALFESIQEVLLVDGQGQTLKAPASLVCGAEGLWGVIIEMKVQLKKRPLQQKIFCSSASWVEILNILPMLRSLQTLVSLIWFGNHFYLVLEGEDWRVACSIKYLMQHILEIQETSLTIDNITTTFIPTCRNFIAITSVLHSHQLLEACRWANEQANHLQLECLQQVDVLAGSIHLILQAKIDEQVFNQKIEQFLVLWADFIDCHQGSLASCHGIGKSMHAYMPPFWAEESQQSWRHLQALFDPKKLFVRERFFPILEKSLVKVNQRSRLL